jgi:transglutaminase superfamily protein
MEFLFWRALFGFLIFDLRGFGHNFLDLYGFVRSQSVSTRSMNPQIVSRVCIAVNRASVWYPKRVQCLQRSMVTTCMLRRYGVPAKMVLGAQTVPVKAHAWTEVDGKAINERRDVQRIYAVWERC